MMNKIHFWIVSMKGKGIFSLLILLMSFNAIADSSHECDIVKIDSNKESILVYVNDCDVVSGDGEVIPQGNGFSNDSSGSQSYLWLARDKDEIEETKHQLSLILSALMANRRGVIRWEVEESKSVITSLLIK